MASATSSVALPQRPLWTGAWPERMAIRTGRAPVHDGRWAKATVEVALAILRSARDGREIALQHQVAVPDGL